MRAMNLVLLSISFAFLSVLGMCYFGEMLFGDSAKYIVALPAIALAAMSRRIVEKVLGYTLLEAFKKDGEDGQN